MPSFIRIYRKNGTLTPITALWEYNGSGYNLMAENDDNDSIAAGQTYYDSGFSLSSLSAGDYLFTVATYANFATGTSLSDGFAYDSQTPILLSEWNQPANHYGMGSYYRVNLDGIDSASNNTDPVPEPATMLLFGTGIAGLVGSRLRKKK